MYVWRKLYIEEWLERVVSCDTMAKLRSLRITLENFEEWLRSRGYDGIMGEKNLNLFLDIGLVGLFFSNSSLLMSYILTQLGLPSERLADKIKFEVGRKIKELRASRDYLEIMF
jgi:hypothetical protein